MNTARHADLPEQPVDNDNESSPADAAESLRATARQVFEELSTSPDVASFLAAAVVLAGRADDGSSRMVNVFQSDDGRVFFSVGLAVGAAESFSESCAEVLEQIDESTNADPSRLLTVATALLSRGAS